jgi:hypothetical protein
MVYANCLALNWIFKTSFRGVRCYHTLWSRGIPGDDCVDRECGVSNLFVWRRHLRSSGLGTWQCLLHNAQTKISPHLRSDAFRYDTTHPAATRYTHYTAADNDLLRCFIRFKCTLHGLRTPRTTTCGVDMHFLPVVYKGATKGAMMRPTSLRPGSTRATRNGLGVWLEVR